MIQQKYFSSGKIERVLLASLLVALLALTGCGTDSYGEAVKKSLPELEVRGKFAALAPAYQQFPGFPIAFRIPKMFQNSDPDQSKLRWKSYDGKAVKLNSKDPHELQVNPDSKISINPASAIPPEMYFAQLNSAHQGTFLCEYKVMLEESNNPGYKTDFHEQLMLSIWMFDTSPKSRIKPPSDSALLSQVKAAGKAPPKAAWEEDSITVLPSPENPTPEKLTAKLARFPVTSKFLKARGDTPARPVEMKGLVRLWSFKLENKYQVYVMLRVPLDMTTGDEAEFPQEADSPDSDRLLELGRAVIGSMAVVPESTPEGDAKQK